MNDVALKITYIFMDLIAPLIVGYLMKRYQVLTNKQCNWLIRFNIIVVFTVLSWLSFWVLPLQMDLLLLPAYSLLTAVVPGVIIYLFGMHKKFSSMSEQGSYIITSISSNIGTLAGLCAFIIYGEIGFAYAQMVSAFQNLVMLFLFFPLGHYYKYCEENKDNLATMSIQWRQVFVSWNQLPVLGMLVGMALYIYAVPRPPMLEMTFHSLVHVGAWLGLLPLGFLIDFSGIKHYLTKTFVMLPVKMFVTPLILCGIAALFTQDPVLLGSIVLFTSAPCAINGLMTVRLYDLNVDLSMALFISTMCVYVLILFPLFYELVTISVLPFK